MSKLTPPVAFDSTITTLNKFAVFAEYWHPKYTVNIGEKANFGGHDHFSCEYCLFFEVSGNAKSFSDLHYFPFLIAHF